MTAQLAKIVERVLRLAFSSALTSDMCIGQNQFAYREDRGSRDSLAYLVLTWLCGFREKARFGLYVSDVSAAFDRVFTERLMAKLRARKVPDDLLKVFSSWLQVRWAEFVVGSEKSNKYLLENMVFQGTVWGPLLWNVFYEDSAKAIKAQALLK